MLLFAKAGSVKISALYDCSKCDTNDKKIRGCKRNRRNEVFTCDCICEGAEKCSICGGIKRDNTIRVRRCPCAILKEQCSRIVPYFYHYIGSGMMQYPDGKGLLYQPNKLLAAFDILFAIYKREKKEEVDKDVKDKR